MPWQFDVKLCGLHLCEQPFSQCTNNIPLYDNFGEPLPFYCGRQGYSLPLDDLQHVFGAILVGRKRARGRYIGGKRWSY